MQYNVVRHYTSFEQSVPCLKDNHIIWWSSLWQIEDKTPLCIIVQTAPALAHFGRNGIANKTIIFYHMQYKNDRDFFWKYIQFFYILRINLLL